MFKARTMKKIFVLAVTVVILMSFSLTGGYTATNTIKGVNWADSRDNFVNGVLYVSGLSSSDTYSSAGTVADRIISQFMALTGSNTVRMPINEPTVSSYWSTYTGAIDKALSKGKVILCYWAYSSGKPANMTNYWNMWTTVVNKYGSNSNCYFEPINEPYGYSATDLCNLYNTWLSNYSSVPDNRVILDGTGYAENLSAVGADSRLSGCLLGVHDYAFWKTLTSEGAWQNDLGNAVGNYASRTVMTEWGAAMTTGLNYNATSTNNEVCYIRGIGNQLRGNSMGSCYWPGLRDGDSYGITRKSGSGSGITLTVTNASGLNRIKYAWGDTFIKVRNAATGLVADGMGRTANGSDAAQYSASSSNNQQWAIEGAGTYVKIKNRATGLYLDGMGRTANGSVVGQYAGSGSYNQQWLQVISGSNVKFQNRATGLYIDGMGSTANGSTLCQYTSGGSTNQQWQVVVP